MALFETAGSIINDAAVELGLAPLANSGASVAASTDPNFILLFRLLKRVGRQLALEREWVQLRQEHSFVTDALVTEYDLPADFSRMIDQAGWNRSQDRRMHVSGAELWQHLKATDSSWMLSFLFLPKDRKIEVWPQPPVDGETISFAYMSRYWAGLEVGSPLTPTLDAPTSGQHLVYFDPTLVVPALKLAYCRARGFDTTAVEEEYKAAYSVVASANVNAAPVLAVTRSPCSGVRLLDEWNLPDTGYGS